MKRRNVFFIMIMLFVICLSGCGDSEKIRYNTKEELEDYIKENNLEENYAQFDFSIEDLKTEEYGEAHYYIYAFSAEYDLDEAEKLVEQAQEDGIHIYAEMGSIYTCKVWYNYHTDGQAYWNALDAEGRVSEEFEDITNIDKEELKKYLDDNENNLIDEVGIAGLLVQAYDYIEETEIGSTSSFKNAKLFVTYYEEIMELEVYEGAEPHVWYAPINYIENDDTMTFIYENGKTLIINLSDWTTSVGYVDNSVTDEIIDTNNNAEYYLNSQGILVDKVEEFETQTFGEYVVKYPILNDGVDEVVVYEFDTYDNIHVVLDASNVYQQTNLDEIGDYGDVQLEQIAPGRDIAYMFDGERYYIEDYTINLLTISKPINDN